MNRHHLLFEEGGPNDNVIRRQNNPIHHHRASSMIIKVSEYIPGILGRVTEMHARYYHHNWGFGLFFETKVAAELADFLNRFDPVRDGLWVALMDRQIVGAIAICGREADALGARLRWLIVAPEWHDRGLGKRLLREAVGFCKSVPFKRIYLTTFGGLDAARHLYEKEGFRLVIEQEDTHWGKAVLEQTFELML
jgi:GNAT superfamily N-acetyltransferase